MPSSTPSRRRGPLLAFCQSLTRGNRWVTRCSPLPTDAQIFYEPQTSSEVEGVLRDYAHAIESPKLNDAGRPRSGALLFAVVGGKLSEGTLWEAS